MLTRRAFLHHGGHGLAGSVALRGLVGTLGALATASLTAPAPARADAPAATDDYKALVCVFLFGGNDGFNVLIPRDDATYKKYAAPRPGLAVAQGSLVAINGGEAGASWGLSPEAKGLGDLYAAGRLAFVRNVGPLLAPTTVADYKAGRHLPPELFSHNDQRDAWMSATPDQLRRTGWGGRLAERLAAAGAAAPLSLMGLTLGGQNLFQSGAAAVPYALRTTGVESIDSMLRYSGNARHAAWTKIMAESAQTNVLERQVAAQVRDSLALGSQVSTALAGAPALATGFPATGLGQQLKQIAGVIGARGRLGVKRQVFFATLGGFDTHDSQLADQPALIQQVADALVAFDAAMGELGTRNSVVAFTASDFGRTLTTNGDGTDHGWGNHHWVLGGAVKGGALYGNTLDYALGGAEDTGGGRFVPSTATDQYAAPLARWMGVAASDMADVLPNLSRFGAGNVGFL